jgi:competence protein ComGD
MLLVLMAVMVLAGIAVPSYRTLAVDREEARFFEGLLHDIYFAQSETYRTQASAMVVFRETGGTYEVVQNFQALLPPRKLPATVRLKKTSNITGVYFTANGSVTTAGTLRFDTGGGERTLVVHLGKGRVVLSE